MRVLVVNTRGLHLGYLGCYGCDWVATPHLDRLASESVVFDQHFADCPRLVRESGGGSRSAWTGRHGPPLIAGTSDNLLARALHAHERLADFVECGDWGRVGAALEPLVKRMKRAATGLWWLDLPDLAPPWQPSEELLAEYFVEADDDTEALAPWLDPPAGPLDTEGADLERLQSTYAAVVAGFDERLGEILGRVDDYLGDDLFLIVTADCGLALGEHGVVGEYRAWLHEEIAHVPLVMRLPGKSEAGRRVRGLTQPMDLFPTLLEGVAVPAPISQGHCLLPLARGDAEQARPFACSALRIGQSCEWALRTPHWTFLLPIACPTTDRPRSPQLFVKPDDRWEVNDVHQHHMDQAEELEQTLRDFAAAAAM